jgi:hypothetical protein
LQPVANFDGNVKSRLRHEHTFPDIDLALDEFPERATQRAAVERFLDTAIRVKVCVNPSGRISGELDNIGPGHNMPSGAAQDRRVWIEVVSYDALGNVLFSSGVVPDGSPVVEMEAEDPDLVLLRDQTFDKNGEPAHMFWEVATINDEHTIPGVITTELIKDGMEDQDYYAPVYPFSYPSSEGSGLPTRVTLIIHVRPVGLEVIDDLIKTGHLEDRHRDALPTFSVLPNRGLDASKLPTDVTVEWTTEALERSNGCVQTGESLRSTSP